MIGATADRSLSELDVAAARLAWVMVRFSQAGLPPAVTKVPELGGVLGEVAVKLFPRGTVVPLEGASAMLLELPKPVVLTALSARGLIGVWHPAHVAREDREALETLRRHSHKSLAAFCHKFGLTAGSRLLLEAENNANIFPVRVFRRYIRDYHVTVGWLLHPTPDDQRAAARLQLLRADGCLS
jgi:hypothetical protein